MARSLPVGIQSFEKLRRDGFVYVDKTALVYKLAEAPAQLFLARPRRFGKSLLLSTLKAYFEGRRELFEGLAIERLTEGEPSAWQPRPVFLLSFNGADYTREGGLEGKLEAQLRRWERRWETDGSGLGFGDRLYNLLELAHEVTGRRVAVLVDEYDKPLLEAERLPELEASNRACLKGVFSTLKDADEHLHFVFITGVTRFSKVSIFSDLNQLADISLDERYAAACGITEDELLGAFAPELEAFSAKLGVGAEECLRSLRDLYDGYCFHPDGPVAGSKVYNPFSVINALFRLRLGPYWYATGTPTFLARRVVRARLDPRALVEGGVHATEGDLANYRADDPDPVPLMFQTGYLTISGRDPRTGRYDLAVPNGEVEEGLLKGLLPTWAPGYASYRGTDVLSLLDYVEAGDTNGMRDVLSALFASIPYIRADDLFENYFQSVLWLTFALLGRYVACEVHQALGRADVVVEAAGHVYVMEFKRGGTAAEALAQVGERGYAAPFAADPRQVHLVGCAFDERTRQLADWQEALPR